jgi:hypothetical protein
VREEGGQERGANLRKEEKELLPYYLLVKITPHAPGMLFVGVVPRKPSERDPTCVQKQKSFILKTHEFGSNPP